MALGQLAQMIERDLRESIRAVAEQQRRLEDTQAQAEKLAKNAVALTRQIEALENQNQEAAATVAILEDDLNRGRCTAFRQEEHLDMLLQLNRSAELAYQTKQLEMQKRFSSTEQDLQLQLNRFQSLPKAQAMVKLQEERTRLRNLVKVLTIKQANAARGLIRGEPPLPKEDVLTFKDFCVNLAKTALSGREHKPAVPVDRLSVTDLPGDVSPNELLEQQHMDVDPPVTHPSDAEPVDELEPEIQMQQGPSATSCEPVAAEHVPVMEKVKVTLAPVKEKEKITLPLAKEKEIVTLPPVKEKEKMAVKEKEKVILPLAKEKGKVTLPPAPAAQSNFFAAPHSPDPIPQAAAFSFNFFDKPASDQTPTDAQPVAGGQFGGFFGTSPSTGSEGSSEGEFLFPNMGDTKGSAKQENTFSGFKFQF